MKTIKETTRTKVQYDNKYNALRFVRKIDNKKSDLICGELANDIMMDVTANAICDGTIDLMAVSKIN